MSNKGCYRVLCKCGCEYYYGEYSTGDPSKNTCPECKKYDPVVTASQYFSDNSEIEDTANQVAEYKFENHKRKYYKENPKAHLVGLKLQRQEIEQRLKKLTDEGIHCTNSFLNDELEEIDAKTRNIERSLNTIKK